MNATADTDTTGTAGATANLGSFVAGLAFMAIGVAFVLEANGQWSFQLEYFRYFGPLVLMLIGISILASVGLGRRR